MCVFSLAVPSSGVCCVRPAVLSWDLQRVEGEGAARG